MKNALCKSTLGLLAAGAVLITGSAQGQAFTEDFESYTVGGGINGQGGWSEWCQSAGVDVTVTNLRARSGSKSIQGDPGDDMTHRVDATSGMWELSLWTFVPSGATGNVFFIVLNDYPTASECQNWVYTFNQWSAQVRLNADTNVCEDAHMARGTPVPLVRDQWVEVRIVVDLDSDLHEIFYNNTPIFAQPEQWSGANNAIEAIDLFAETGTYWYDDLSVQPVSSETPLCPGSFTAVRGLLVGGTLGNLCGSDNAYLTHRPDVFRTSAVPPVQIQMDFTSPTETPSELRVHVESAANANNIAQRTLIWNNDTQAYDLLNTRTLSQTDSSIDLVINTNPGRYVQSGTGRIRLLVQANALAFTIAPVWQHRLDDVVVTVVN